jgi:phosphoglycerate dehydrogenase-like enzyme
MANPLKLVSLGVLFSGENNKYLFSAGCGVHQYNTARDLEDGLRAAEDADAVCVSNVWIRYLPPDFINRLLRCRLLVIGGAGTDMLAMENARRRGIAIANCPLYSAPAVAEHAFALILSLARKLYLRPERSSGPELASYEASARLMKGMELRGKTLGIAGYGRIGRQLARIAGGFGMRVAGFKRKPPRMLTRALFHRQTHFVGFGCVLCQSDVIVSTLPGTPEARNLFNAEAFARMRRGCLFVNVGRAQGVDEAALQSALEQGIIAGAGLDVVSQLGARNLRPMKNVIISPHIGWNTTEAEERLGRECATTIVRFFSGRPVNLIPARTTGRQ